MKYCTLVDKNIFSMEIIINNYLQAGWELYGYLTISPVTKEFIQAMIKKE